MIKVKNDFSLFLTQVLTCAIGVANREILTRAHIGCLIGQLILSRISFELRRCRPEQFWCYASSRKDISMNNINISIFILALTIAAFVWRNWNKWGSSLIERFTGSMILPVVIGIWVSWILPVIPQQLLTKYAHTVSQEKFSLISGSGWKYRSFANV